MALPSARQSKKDWNTDLRFVLSYKARQSRRWFPVRESGNLYKAYPSPHHLRGVWGPSVAVVLSIRALINDRPLDLRVGMNSISTQWNGWLLSLMCHLQRRTWVNVSEPQRHRHNAARNVYGHIAWIEPVTFLKDILITPSGVVRCS